MGLYLTCASEFHLAASIDHPGIIVPLAAAIPCIHGNRLSLNALPVGAYYCWGCTTHRTPTFNRLRVGDEVLLSKNGSNYIDYHGYITYKLPNPDKSLANAIWGSDHDNIFIIGNIRSGLGIDKDAFMLDLTGKNDDTLQSPRDIGLTRHPNLWIQYNRIKAGYGI